MSDKFIRKKGNKFVLSFFLVFLFMIFISFGSPWTYSPGNLNLFVFPNQANLSFQVPWLVLNASNSTVSFSSVTGDGRWVSRNDWTTIDNYPTGCPSGQYVNTLGDTLTCAIDLTGAKVSDLNFTDYTFNKINTTSNISITGNNNLIFSNGNFTIGVDPANASRLLIRNIVSGVNLTI